MLDCIRLFYKISKAMQPFYAPLKAALDPYKNLVILNIKQCTLTQHKTKQVLKIPINEEKLMYKGFCLVLNILVEKL